MELGIRSEDGVMVGVTRKGVDEEGNQRDASQAYIVSYS